MLTYRDEFTTTNVDFLALCGYHVSGDSIHVGLCWSLEDEKKIIHFLNGDNIPVQEFSDKRFENYFFVEIADFPVEYLPSISAISELISENEINGFKFSRSGSVYDGGIFEFSSGEYTGKTPVEKYINCAVFVLILLKTFDYELLNWNSWPDVREGQLFFLDEWLNHNGVTAGDKAKYYKLTKEVRGRHVFVCPFTATKPSLYHQVQPLSYELITCL